MNHIYRTLLATVALAFSSVAASADTITVCADGCDYSSIQDAIDAANSGDIIQLCDNYFELDARIDIQAKGITLAGIDGARTILDGSALPEAGSMFYISGNGEPMRFERLRIQGIEGTGVQCSGLGSPLFISCEFADLARGVDAANGCGPDFFGCTFEQNNSLNAPNRLVRGAAMELNGSETIIEGCLFSENITPPFNGEEFAAVKATSTTSIIIRDSVFCGNTPADIAGRWQDGGGNSFSLVCELPCAGDLTGEGGVNAADLGILIAVWGTDGLIVEGSDINGDGVVNAADLGLLIGAWGPCQ